MNNNKKSLFFVKCPSCTNNISIFKVREEFKCGHCGSVINCPNYLEITLKSLGLYLGLTFIFYFFHFNFWTVALDLIIFFTIILNCLNSRLEYTLPPEARNDKNTNENYVHGP